MSLFFYYTFTNLEALLNKFEMQRESFPLPVHFTSAHMVRAGPGLRLQSRCPTKVVGTQLFEPPMLPPTVHTSGKRAENWTKTFQCEMWVPQPLGETPAPYLFIYFFSFLYGRQTHTHT